MQKFYIDSETTGLSNGYHELTEISIIRLEDLVQKTWHIKIKYPDRATPEALKMTGKTIDYLLNNGKYIEEIADDVEAFLNEDGLGPENRANLAFNCSFDRRFIEDSWKSINRIWPVAYWLDVREQARKYVKLFHSNLFKPSLSQENMLKLTKVAHYKGYHGAEIDCQNLCIMHQFFNEKGITDIEFIKKSPTLIKLAEENSKTNILQISDLECTSTEEEKTEFYSFEE